MVEVWRDIRGYRGLYQISNYGQVKRLSGVQCKCDRILKQTRTSKYSPYLRIGLYKNHVRKLFKIHRLVLETFIGPKPRDRETRHLDGNPHNNRLDNLIYGTHLENMRDKVIQGGSMSLPDAIVTEMYHQGHSCAYVARSDKCSETSMYNRLKSLGINIRSRSKANKTLPDSLFISLYNIGLSSSQIGRLLGVDSSTVTKRLHTLKFPLRSRGVACRIRYTEKEFQQYFMVPDVLDQLMELAG